MPLGLAFLLNSYLISAILSLNILIDYILKDICNIIGLLMQYAAFFILSNVKVLFTYSISTGIITLLIP